MPRAKKSSPTLQLAITQEERERAIKSKSGGCLIADAIKRQYPNLTRVSVDMATIRATDAERGQRYIYLTPPSAQHVLLAFDQGWSNPTEQVTVRRAVKIEPITRRPGSVQRATKRRAERIAELEAKVEAGEELTAKERAALTRMKAAKPAPERPATAGPATVDDDGVVRGGNRMQATPKHPNLLAGRNRHFGAKLADPGEAFQEAVDEAVEQKLAERAQGEVATG